MKVGRKWVKIQTWEVKNGKLPVTVADQTTMILTEYLPKVRIGHKDKEVAVYLWIAPNSENEDISLSKSVMHQPGFQLVSANGTKVWDMEGDPVLEVEVALKIQNKGHKVQTKVVRKKRILQKKLMGKELQKLENECLLADLQRNLEK